MEVRLQILALQERSKDPVMEQTPWLSEIIRKITTLLVISAYLDLHLMQWVLISSSIRRI